MQEGRVNKIETKTGSSSRGDWKLWRIQVGTHWYGTFEDPGIVEGDYIEFQSFREGKNDSIVNIKRIQDPDPTGDTSQPHQSPGRGHSVRPTGNSGSGRGGDSEQIARSVVFKGLTDLMGSIMDMSLTDKRCAIIADADFWTEWILTGRFPPKSSQQVDDDVPY